VTHVIQSQRSLRPAGWLHFSNYRLADVIGDMRYLGRPDFRGAYKCKQVRM